MKPNADCPPSCGFLKDAAVTGTKYEHVLLAMGQIWPHQCDRRSCHLLEDPTSCWRDIFSRIFTPTTVLSYFTSPWYNSSKKQAPCRETVRWEPFSLSRPWGENPFSSPANKFFGHHWNPCTATTLPIPPHKLPGAPAATSHNLPCLPKPGSTTSLGISALGSGTSTSLLPHISHTCTSPREQGTGR